MDRDWPLVLRERSASTATNILGTHCGSGLTYISDGTTVSITIYIITYMHLQGHAQGPRDAALRLS